MADCNHGPSVTAEYRFVLRNEDGSETLLQDYGVDTLYTCAPDALNGKTLRVYARVKDGNPEEHWYDLVIPGESALDRWARIQYNKGYGSYFRAPFTLQIDQENVHEIPDSG